MKKEVKKEDLLYPGESYEICGALFDVFKDLGPGYREINYQRAAKIAFENKGFKVEREIKVPVQYQGHDIGFYRLDFLINDKIIVELKCSETT
ncbi:MAG: GxxExxY protein, partial [Candidatus Uhrbacteria bacterium]